MGRMMMTPIRLYRRGLDGLEPYNFFYIIITYDFEHTLALFSV